LLQTTECMDRAVFCRQCCKAVQGCLLQTQDCFVVCFADIPAEIGVCEHERLYHANCPPRAPFRFLGFNMSATVRMPDISRPAVMHRAPRGYWGCLEHVVPDVGAVVLLLSKWVLVAHFFVSIADCMERSQAADGSASNIRAIRSVHNAPRLLKLGCSAGHTPEPSSRLCFRLCFMIGWMDVE